MTKKKGQDTNLCVNLRLCVGSVWTNECRAEQRSKNEGRSLKSERLKRLEWLERLERMRRERMERWRGIGWRGGEVKDAEDAPKAPKGKGRDCTLCMYKL